MRGTGIRLLDALDQIDLIRRFAEPGREVFFRDILIQSAILHRLALLGESCGGISAALRAAHDEVPWAQIVALRNVVVHQNFGVDLDLVWAIVAEHIAPLASAIESILKSLAAESAGGMKPW